MTADPVRIDILREALRYASAAWFVFPVHYITADKRCSCGRICGRAGKHPATANGSKDASVSPDTIKQWWGRDPNFNVGIACGPSKLMVVDVDPRNGGDETFAELEQKYGELPSTLTCLTGGGGQHYYFDVAGVDGIFRGRVLGQGIELQATGQYVIAPPSNHMLGTYQWDYGQPNKPEFPPAWLLDENKRKNQFAAQAGAPLDCILGVAFSAAGMMGQAIGPDRVAVQCPWESDHSQGSRFDASTVVFGAARGKWGWFHCSHAHCKERLQGLDPAARNNEIMRALPEKAGELARTKIKGADRELRRLTRAEWETALAWNPRGDRYLPTAGNLKLMMENLPDWSGAVAYDESVDRLYWTRAVPDVPGLTPPTSGAEIAESDWIYLAQWFSVNKHVDFPKHVAADVLYAMGRANTHNSLTQYLQGVAWDGVERVDTWLSRYCGAADTEATRAIAKSWMISAIARALQPGVQVDHVLVLEGDQGLGKTTVFRTLGGRWYLGNLPHIEDKDARHILSGSWIVEIQELAALRGAMIEKVKAYITERVDTYRPPYSRDFVKRQRRCVFGASTNADEWNGDHTGARRFWPVKVTLIDREGLERDRDQLWAEARDRFLAGESYWIPANLTTVQSELKELQESRRIGDPWEESIARYAVRCELAGAAHLQIDSVLSDLGIEPGKRTPVDANRVARCLSRLGYVRRRLSTAGRPWVYVRPAQPLPLPADNLPK